MRSTASTGLAIRGQLPRAVLAALCVALSLVVLRADAPQASDAGIGDFAQRTRPSSVPDDLTLESEGAVIGEIWIQVTDVFDTSNPKENNKIFRFANRLHIRTRDHVIRRELLFKSGEPYSGRKLAESERLLRASRLFYDARVYPVRYENGRVDVQVIVRDVWTLIAGLGFGRGGGENTIRVGLEDSNFLGFGKDVGIQWNKDVDRTSVLYRYRDPNLAGTRLILNLWYQDNSDGFLKQIDFGRPFFSLDTRYAGGLSAMTWERNDPLYDLGEITSEFRHEEDNLEIRGGFSPGLVDRNVDRWSFGVTYARDRFAPIEGATLPGSLPEDRLLIYPWVGFSLRQERYAKMQNVDKIHRTEDINFATEIQARLGWSNTAFGADRNQTIVSALFSTTVSPGPRQILIAEVHGSGRFGSEGGENLLSGGSVRYFLPDLAMHHFYVALAVDAAYNLDQENQLLLGGDNGLRGYPLRYQDGDRRVLLTVEQRFYTRWYVLRLVRVGAAIFFDAGAAWFAGRDGDPTELGLLRDVGFGLRLSSTRSSRGSMLHLDLAFPLDGDDSIESVQFLVKAKRRF